MELKPRILSVVAVILFLTLIVIVGLRAEIDTKAEEESPNISNRGVVAWLTAFTERDYSLCDAMLEDSSDGLYSQYVSMRLVDGTYYETALNGLVSCIESVKIKSIERDTSTGVVTYTVTVTFNEYLRLGDLVYDEDALDSARKLYEKEEIGDAEFQTELSRVYYEIFCNSCFQESDADTRQKDLILSEKEVNGVTCVYNTVSFVDSLLSDSNLLSNLSVFERDVKGKVNNIIKAN